MRNQILLLLCTLACISKCRSQAEHLNPGYFLSLYNPAFTASPVDFNRASLSWLQPDRYSLVAHHTLSGIYSAVGGFAHTEQDRFTGGINFAYHTYFLPSQYHLCAGIQPRITFQDGASESFRLRFGLMLNAPGQGTPNWFVGSTYTTSQLNSRSRDSTYSRSLNLQAGKSLLAITRRITVNSLLIAAFQTAGTSSKDKLDMQLYTNFYRYGKIPVSLSPGWITEDFHRHALAVRAGFTRYVRITAAYARYFSTSNQSGQNGFEISIQYLYK